MKKEENKNNALVWCESNGRFTNLFVEFNDKEGSKIKILVKPISKDNKSLAKLMYKISKALE